MNDDFRTTPPDWDYIERWAAAANEGSAASYLLELRARVEALEAAQQPATCPHIVSSDEGTSYCRLAEQTQNKLDRLIELDRDAPAPPASLVERVAGAIADSDDPHELWYEDARAAILTAATWLREQVHTSAASALEREVGQ